MTQLTDFIINTFTEAFGRQPKENELSLYLQRALLQQVPREILAREILRAANEQFARDTWQRCAGREPTYGELEQAVTVCATGRLGREAFLREFEPPTNPVDLLQLEGEAFIRATWRLLAKREPDAKELAETDTGLRQGALSKRDVLRRLGAPATPKEKMLEWPLLGRLFRVVYLIRRLPIMDKSTQSLEYRISDLETQRPRMYLENRQ